VVDYASVDGALMRRNNVEQLVMIGGPTDVVVSLAAPRLSTPRPVRANVAESKPPHDETKQEMTRRAKMYSRELLPR
jgi:hypothetical protein